MAPEERSEPPLGTVTFVLADVEPEAALARPERVIDAALATHHGARLDRLGQGAGAVAVFESAADAVAAAHQIQRALAGDANTVLAGPRLRLGIHTGEAEAREHRACGGPALHRGARLRDVAHGGQALLSSVTASLVADALPAGAWLVDRGTHRLRDEALAARIDRGLWTFHVDSLDALASHAARAESFAEAARLYAASDAGRERMGYPRPPVDHAGHEAAVACLRASLGDERLAAAWSEGAALTLDDAVAYARRARTSRSRPSTGWASLTQTEVEVVGLAADGLTNPEIAARLFMSRNTVRTHLSHVYAKLGVTNRTELATGASAHWLPSPEVRPTGGVEHVLALARSGGHGPKYCSVGSALDRIR